MQAVRGFESPSIASANAIGVPVAHERQHTCGQRWSRFEKGSKMKIFSVDVLICATAYIKADTEEEARAKLAALKGDGMDLSTDSHPDFDLAICGISCEQMGNDDVADVTLSPAMTLHGPLTAATIEGLGIDDNDGLEEAHEFVDVEPV
jgi:hypothetical protein